MFRRKNTGFIQAYMEFTDAMMKKLSSEEDGNVFISPLSIITGMAMLLECTEGETRQEILDAFGIQDAEQLIHGLRLVTDMNSSDDAFQSANALISSNYMMQEIKQTCIDMLKKEFDAEVFVGKKMAQKINSWVNEKTCGMIPEVINESEQLDAAVINAVTFLGEWMKKYDSRDLQDKCSFTNSRGKVESVTMMSSYERSYVEDSNCEGFVKPYSCGYDFMAVLPKNPRKKLKKLVRGDLIRNLSNLYDARSEEFGTVMMPEIEFRFQKSLRKILRTMGIKKAFSYTTEMSPMTDLEGAFITDVTHQTFVKVDADGTKASACTMVGVAGGMPRKSICLDRPYIFAIMHRETGLPIFVGMVNTVNGTK